MRKTNRRLGRVALGSPRGWALSGLLLTAALSLGGYNCIGWEWSAQPLVLVTEDGCQGNLALVEWGWTNVVDGETITEPNIVLARELRENDCVEGINRERWHRLYLWCEIADPVDATSGLITTVKVGQAGEPFRERCERIVVAETP